ncbi:hypothetical protein POM88_015478 [Heracleum sosnowskyi]|uniref:Exportin-7/Ran-binding protein 17 TPR repeats domain-containing protein n=1 Tax=Heracleum sosnowskyi TaxID=360622 RepID=A0AAD8MS51_9APIA|nr:hypothetical protein POM88_015478 [Heracleum sosnowskyi]
MLNVIVGKIARNLKCYVESEDAITRNLDLFLELASGYTSCKLLLKLETVHSIIMHSNREHFSFLRDNRFSLVVKQLSSTLLACWFLQKTVIQNSSLQLILLCSQSAAFYGFQMPKGPKLAFGTITAKLLLQLATAFKDGGLCDRSGKFFYKDHLHKSNVPVLAVAGSSRR